MATVTKYIDRDNNGGAEATGDSWGDAYPTLDAWQTANAKDLVTATETHVAYYRAANNNPRTAVFTFSGWTTSSEYNVSLIVPVANRHSGRRGTGTRIIVEDTGFGTPVLSGTPNYTRIEGLSVENGGGATEIGLGSYSRIIGCLFVVNGSGGGRPTIHHLSVAQNCIFIRIGANVEAAIGASSSAENRPTFINCTGYRSGGDNTVAAIAADTNGYIARSCYAYSVGATRGYSQYQTSRSDCFSGNDDDPDGYVSFDNAAFEETDVLLLTSSSALIDAGQDNSAHEAWDGEGVDILGTPRPQGSAWDIGAHEFAVVVPMPQYIYGE